MERSEDIRLAVSKIICAPGLKPKIRRQMVEILDRLDSGKQLVGEHRKIAESLLSVLDGNGQDSVSVEQ